jgi:hypothetical protein
MLALSLVSLVLVAVAMAIDVHLRMLGSGRTKVEEAQLARTLLRRIADDLRGAVLYDPMSVEDLVPAMASGDLGGMSEGDLSGLASGAGLDSADLGDGEMETDSTSDLAESTVPQTVPGLYGNSYELQIDTSRLPRIDQYDGMLTTDDLSLADRVSEVKTVTYYVIGNQLGGSTYGTSLATSYSQEGSQYQTGLVRRELDRATTAWAAENGTLLETAYDVEPVAPEVAAIEFLYFDGSEWLNEWDSEEHGGLPVAVQIAIAISHSRGRPTESNSLRTSTGLTGAGDDELLIYRLLVHLPTAQPTTGEESSEESSADGGGVTDSAPGESLSPGGEESGR